MEESVQKWIESNISSQENKRFLITGATSGLGFELAKCLLGLGASVIIAGRSQEKLTKSVEELATLFPQRRELIESILIDLSDLESVQAAAKNLISRNVKIHALVNNAGIMATPYAISKQGYEMQFASNHLGHFLLTNLLLDSIDSPEGRIVSVSSLAYNSATGVSNPKIQEADYRAYEVYANSKLANILFTQKLNDAFATTEDKRRAYVVHPGVSATNLIPLPSYARFLVPVVGLVMKSTFGQSATMGMLSSLMCATLPHDVLDSTKLYGPEANGKTATKGFPKGVTPRADLAKESYKQELWDLSMQLVESYR